MARPGDVRVPAPLAGRVRLLLLALMVLLGTACEVRTSVDVHVDEDGGGRVAVVVVLDADALAKVPDLAAQLRTADLEATGWKIGEPEPTDGGGLRIAAEKRFSDPGQIRSLMSELTGPEGPFRDFRIDRDHSFGETAYRVRGVVDLSDGVEAFGDEALREVLGGEMFGRPVAVLELQAARPLAEAAPFRVTVHLPGGVEQAVEPVLGGEPVEIDAESSVRSDRAWFLARAAAATAVVALVLLWLVGTRHIGRRRPPPRQYRGLHRIEDDDLYEPPTIRPG